MSSEDKLSKSRSAYKGQITSFNNKLEGLTVHNANLITLTQRLKHFEESYERYKEVQLELEILNAEQASDRHLVEDAYFEGFTRATELIQLLQRKQKMEHLDSEPIVPNSPQFPRNSFELDTRAILPKIKLTSFNGKEESWDSFFQLFDSLVHSNPEIPVLHKFHYLKSSLEGQALEIIQPLSITRENYSIALEILKHRYDNPRLKVRKHIQALFQLSNIKSNNLHSVRTLIDQVQLNIKCLNNYEEPEQQLDSILVYLVTSKFDPDTLKAWEVEVSHRKEHSFVALMEFLEQRCQVLSAVAFSEEPTQQSSRHPSRFKNSAKSSRFLSTPKKLTPTSQVFNTSTTSFKCSLCPDNHFLYYCPKFKAMTVDERRRTVQRFSKCFNCLSGKHSVDKCPSSRTCITCSLKHHSLLHRHEKPTQESNSTDSKPSIPSAQSLTQRASSIRGTQVLLSTAIVQVKDYYGNWIPVRCILDNAATHDFVSESLINKLQLPKFSTSVEVTGINKSSNQALHFVKIQLRDSIGMKTHFNLNCLAIDVIGSETPNTSFDTKNWQIPNFVKLADPTFYNSSPVDLLLSAQVFWKVLLTSKVKVLPGVFARKTKLGWILTGHVPRHQVQVKASCHYANAELSLNLQQFWEIEDCKASPSTHESSVLTEEVFCEQLYKSTTSRCSDGRFVVKLPVKTDFPSFALSKPRALKALFSIERKFRTDPLMQKQYTQFMDEYEALNHMEVVPTYDDSTFDGQPFYLNHHPVWKNPNTREQIRIVFNGSALDSNGVSLNDILFSGPAIQTDLFTVLLNFRLHPIAVMSDIEKMYRQILLDPKQRDLQRILWRDNPKKSVKVFRLNTVTYGLKSSAFLAIRTLRYLAELDGHHYDPRVAELLATSFYVDDFLASFASHTEALHLCEDLVQLLSGGGFHLHKWCSNSSDFLQCSSISTPDNNIQLFQKESTIKALGLFWSTSKDTFHYQAHLSDSVPNTKRQILSEIAKIFDPMQYLAPILVKAKLFMQELWTLKSDWDDPVSESFMVRWTIYRDSLLSISSIVIPRCLLPNSHYSSLELHIFCDSSEKAYGCCAYLVSRTHSSSDGISNLICAKSKVAPLKPVTIPRLELLAAVLATQLSDQLLRELKVEFQARFFWCDSSIVLSWLAKPPTHWQPFVANRVSKIQSLTTLDQWRHISGKENPADVISRGCTPIQLSQHTLYWNGPSWLTKPLEFWPSSEVPICDRLPEVKPTKSQALVVISQPFFFAKYSSFHKLVRVTAYILRWKYFVIDQPLLPQQHLTSTELKLATTKILQLIQRESFSDEIKFLKKGQPLPKSSRLLALSPFIGDDELLRVGGRLSSSNLSEEKKHPILLPSKHHVTSLIIRQFHYQNLHAGNRTLLYILREQYWPINGLHEVNSVVRKCIPCFLASPKAASQIMADLPSIRTEPTRPFALTGVDYAGPFAYQLKPSKSSRQSLGKAYVVLFVCMVTGAIHLELVTNASTSYFLSSFSRFTARRGVPSEVYSDNSLTFRGSCEEIKRAFTSASALETIQDLAYKKGIKWHFIPPYAPHQGGRWESCIKLTKRHLKRVMLNQKLSYEELNSLLIQIEGIVNSRPLGPLSQDPNDLLPLTPSHFLIGDALSAPPSVLDRKSNVSLPIFWKRVQTLKNSFWRRWKLEYLGLLQRRAKWTQAQPNLKVGDLVLLRDPTPPLCWVRGIVTHIFLGRDRRVRVVKVKTSFGSFVRPISSICPLPLEP